ncbi:MAG: preprotein translocase subunit SecY [Bdellovibrionota bacterium]
MKEQLISSARAPELMKKLWITAALLAVYRMGIFVPTPGVNAAALKDLINQGATIFGLFNLFGGGALERFSIFALGIMPYISASIIFSLLGVVSPKLAQLQKEGGELGRKKINQYTRYATVLICVVQAYGMASWLQSNPNGMQIVENPGFSFKLLTVITLTAGTCFIMWLGEQISQRGIGNGISLIIFASIVASFPSAIGFLWEKVQMGEMGGGDFFMFVLLAVAVTAFIVFMERAQRRIPIHHAKKVVGRKMYSASMQFLPLKINMAGVIPPIFASSILLFPGTIAQFLNARFPELTEISLWLSPGRWLYNVFYVVGIVFFCYFYTAIQFNPDDVAENVKKSGGFVPGIRPGKNTAEFIDRVLTRLTTAGAAYISFVCVAPFFFFDSYQIFLGGTSLLIVVGVAMNFVEQVQSHLMAQRYDGFLGEAATRGRKFRARRGA